jgi:hypothetical protein
MQARAKDRRRLVLAAIVVAVVGQAVVLFGDFGPDHPSQDSAKITAKITAAAVAKARAIETPSSSPAGERV